VTAEAVALLRQALELAPAERVDLAAELLASVEPAEDRETVERLWAEEMLRRAEDFQTGKTVGIDGEVVFQQLREKLAEVRKSRQ
jgi:putative addiction module component (TIGR02574 family)